MTDCDATYLFSGVILILVPEQLKLTLLVVVVFSQDETSYLINLEQRGFVSSQLVYCSTFHHLILRSFNLSTLNTRLADLPNSTSPFIVASEQTAFSASRDSRSKLNSTHTLPYPPYGLTAKKLRYTALHTVNTALATLLLTLLALPQQCYYYLHSFWRFYQWPSDSVSRSKPLI